MLLVHRCLIDVHGVPKPWIHVLMLSSSVALGHRELRRSNAKLSPLIRYCSGISPTHFRFWRINYLEIAVKQCKNINVTRDILLPWVPLQSPLQLGKKSIYYHCNSYEVIEWIFTFSARLSSFLCLLTVVVSVDHWEQW